MTIIEKQDLIRQILAGLTEKFEAIVQAAKATYDGAIHEESRAEDKYDTRGLEASYLAGAQAERAAELETAISRYRNLKVREFKEDDPITLTALVEVETDGKTSLYFIGPEGGGMKLQSGGREVTVITAKSPLGSQLVGRMADEEFDYAAGGVQRNCTILSVS